MPGVAFIIPTRNRPAELARTLEAIGRLCGADQFGGAEVIIADNGSIPAAHAPTILDNGIPVQMRTLDSNQGAAARNAAAAQTDASWLVMLDDDSHPTCDGIFTAIASAPANVAAIGAEIVLLNGAREAGGLPEVFVGCGVAIRRDAFERAGGYDPSCQYYAEEYDLAAKLILDGWRVIHDRRFRVLHEKSLTQRSMGHICRRLVRNNAWVAARYAPTQRCSRQAIARDVARYARVAIRENAMAGYGIGFAELIATTHAQRREPMSQEQWDRFVGLDAVRRGLASVERSCRLRVVAHGKNNWAVDQVIREFGFPSTDDPAAADAVIIGTCSPGPMLDAADWWRRQGCRVIEPWWIDAASDEPATLMAWAS